MSVNKIMLMGRLTKDPEKTVLPSGATVTKFGLATNSFYKDKEGNKVEETTFHNIEAWQKIGDVISDHTRKGSMIFIEGMQRNESFETKNGTKGYRSWVIAKHFSFTGSKQEGTTEPKIDYDKNQPSFNTEDIPF